ncbi:hypothetical protein PCE1_000708 [Barthelona sp. PCE]
MMNVDLGAWNPIFSLEQFLETVLPDHNCTLDQLSAVFSHFSSTSTNPKSHPTAILLSLKQMLPAIPLQAPRLVDAIISSDINYLLHQATSMFMAGMSSNEPLYIISVSMFLLRLSDYCSMNAEAFLRKIYPQHILQLLIELVNDICSENEPQLHITLDIEFPELETSLFNFKSVLLEGVTVKSDLINYLLIESYQKSSLLLYFKSGITKFSNAIDCLNFLFYFCEEYKEIELSTTLYELVHEFNISVTLDMISSNTAFATCVSALTIAAMQENESLTDKFPPSVRRIAACRVYTILGQRISQERMPLLSTYCKFPDSVSVSIFPYNVDDTLTDDEYETARSSFFRKDEATMVWITSVQLRKCLKHINYCQFPSEGDFGELERILTQLIFDVAAFRNLDENHSSVQTSVAAFVVSHLFLFGHETYSQFGHLLKKILFVLKKHVSFTAMLLMAYHLMVDYCYNVSFFTNFVRMCLYEDLFKEEVVNTFFVELFETSVGSCEHNSKELAAFCLCITTLSHFDIHIDIDITTIL